MRKRAEIQTRELEPVQTGVRRASARHAFLRQALRAALPEHALLLPGGPLNTVSKYARVLSIAGSDSGGGAGIQADLKTFAALGCFGTTAITALTAQNTTGVRSIHAVPLNILTDQIDAVIEDIGVDSVKIGMLHSADTIQTVAAALERHQLTQVVLDPVMVATSGAALIDPQAIATLVRTLFPKVLLVTPNLDEAAMLIDKPLLNEADMQAAAQQILDMGAKAVLLKGGHLKGDAVCDLLLRRGEAPLWLRSPRIATPNTHGTGCTLSSAIAAYLALGEALPQAVALAQAFVRDALTAGATVRTGAGSGPLNHSFAPQSMHLRALA